MVGLRRPSAVNPSGGARGGDEANLLDLICLRLVPGVGDRRARALLERFGSPARVMSAPRAAFLETVGPSAADARGDPRIRARAREIVATCREKEVRIAFFGAPGYPLGLLALADPPMLLFQRGEMGLLQGPAVAIVGARRASSYGRRVAERLGRDLAAAGITVISGLALGIDGAAHRGALASSGRTMAVLGSGLDVPHPPSHRTLFREIEERGLVISEFLPGEPPLAYNFPRRNRIIAALGDAVVVVEAGPRSGALITVDHALDLGKEVFAVPGPIDDPRSAGSNALLRDGAHLLASARDLADVMDWQLDSGGGPAGSEAAIKVAGVGPDAIRIWRCLEEGPTDLDELPRSVGMSPQRTMVALSELEIAGLVVQEAGCTVRRAAAEMFAN